MDLVKIFTIFSVFIITQSEMIPIPLTSSEELLSFEKNDKTVLLRVPKDIKPGTNITILGKNNKVAAFSATFSGDLMDKHDKCNIFFTPSQHRDQFIIKLDNQNETYKTSYDIDPYNREVSFTLDVIARVTDFGDIMDLYFEETDRGQEPIGYCRFTSFKSLEYILIKGVEHVKNLSFNFSRPDY